MTRRLSQRVVACAALWLVLAGGAWAAGELPERWSHWRYVREIQVPADAATGELVEVLLPAELFEHARTDLADLRLIDDEGAEIGFVLVSPGERSVGTWRDVEMSEAGLLPGGGWQVVADAGTRGAPHDTAEITLSPEGGDAFYWVEVAASVDLRTWRVIRQKAPLYQFEGDDLEGPVTISYPKTRDRWLRFRVSDLEQPLAVERLRIAERGEEDHSGMTVERPLLLDVESPERESRFESDGRVPEMPIVGVRVATQRDEFHRTVSISASDDARAWRPIGRGQIFRLRGEPGDAEPRQSLEVDVPRTAAPYWRVTVLNRGDQPIDDLEVLLLRLDQRLVFKATAEGSPRLIYGNHLAAATSYELERLVTREEASAARTAGLLGEQENLAYRSPEPFTERHPIILWSALALAVVVLGGLALRALR
jgi:hypothetical protein